MDTFVIDTNVLINLDKFNKNVFKSLWNNINSMILEKTLYSIDIVKMELNNQDDRVAEYWNAIQLKHDFFIDLSEKDNPEDYYDVVTMLEQFESFQNHHLNKPLWADPFLIAVGCVDDSIVITDESVRFNKESKIPFVCEQLGVECMNFDDFMIYQRWEW